MRPPEDDALLRDMLDHARRAVAAVSGKERSELESDLILAAALERFISKVRDRRAFPLGNWLGGRDSNPDYTVQSRVSYH